MPQATTETEPKKNGKKPSDTNKRSDGLTSQVDLEGKDLPVVVDYMRTVSHTFDTDHFQIKLTEKRITEWREQGPDNLRGLIKEHMLALSTARIITPKDHDDELEAMTKRVREWLDGPTD